MCFVSRNYQLKKVSSPPLLIIYPSFKLFFQTTIMGDYFFEMGWEPVPLEDTQRHQNLLVIRELIANGLIRDDLAFDLPPPASKEVVAELKERTPEHSDECCTICLKPNADVDPAEAKFIVLPCSHEFHRSCIMPWLEKVSERRLEFWSTI